MSVSLKSETENTRQTLDLLLPLVIWYIEYRQLTHSGFGIIYHRNTHSGWQMGISVRSTSFIDGIVVIRAARVSPEPGCGPGSGKGTQCERIVGKFGFTHLSAGDILRREIASNSEYGTMILNTIKEAKIVLQKLQLDSSKRRWNQVMLTEPNIVLFFDCPEEEMVKRVLNRNQINAVGTLDEIFEQVGPVFSAHEVTQQGWSYSSGVDQMNLKHIVAQSMEKKNLVFHGRLHDQNSRQGVWDSLEKVNIKPEGGNSHSHVYCNLYLWFMYIAEYAMKFVSM
ncbi:hypothetical protein JRO89_XSUnG0258300 [Xanthoceras sorbifolium]|uniref:adenylate kinase n=1 Tax=Xanthoceras sorbifolium TaxID=99658 RepID=A0ABQ8GZ14_9ROSI|nr:hypothetical protein JRO89_XSUnG0258300 [Xanthoceras sorbifolium]